MDTRSLPDKRGGERIGPNPTDRGRPGSKHALVVERQGVPLAVALTVATRHDSVGFADLLDAVPAVSNGQRSRPRRRPDKLHADKGYDYARCRKACRTRHIRDRIAKRGVHSRARLGKHRWVVERTFAWLVRYWRLTVRYERRADIAQAFLSLGCALI